MLVTVKTVATVIVMMKTKTMAAVILMVGIVMMVITAGIQQVRVVHDEKKMNLFRNDLSQEDL